MDFLFAGSINQYTKSLSRQTQWQLKKRNGDFKSHKTSLQDYVTFHRASDVLPEDERDDKLTAILSKAEAGKKLSAEEWEYLRAKNPTMYAKLREVEEEAERYEEALHRCKNRDEAQRLHVSKLGEIMAAAKNGDGGALFRLNRMKNTMTEFTESKEYRDLPTEGEEAIEREQVRKAEQEARQEETRLRDAEREAETETEAEAEESGADEAVAETERRDGNEAAAEVREDGKAAHDARTEEAEQRETVSRKKRKRGAKPARPAPLGPGAGTVDTSVKLKAQMAGVTSGATRAAFSAPAASGRGAPAQDSAPSAVAYGAKAYRQSSAAGAQPAHKVDTGA